MRGRPNIIRITLVIEAGREKNAQVVANRFKKLVPCEQRALFADFPAAGSMMAGDTMMRFRAEFTHALDPAPWEAQVMATLALAQSFGDLWQLTGPIDEVLDLVSTAPNPNGIIWAQVELDRAD